MRERKSILTLLLLLALVLSGMAVPARADGKIAYGAATVNAAVLNVRSGPGKDNSIVGTVTNGSIVVILEQTNNDWYKINFEGTVGYVSTEYLQYVVTSANFTARGTVTADSVRVRKGPGTSYDTVSNCAHGENVDVIGINSGWYKIVTGAGITGYIRSDLMGVTGGRAAGNVPSTTPESGTSTEPTGTVTETDGVVMGWGVRFRTGPGMNYDFITSLNRGTKVTVIGTEGDWYRCIYDGKTGYLNTTLVTLDTSTTRPASNSTQANETKGTVNGSSVRFRESGSTSAKVIASLAKGTVVTVLGTEGDWYRCSYNNKTGYISKTYVTVSGSETAPSDPTPSTPSSSTGKPVVVANSLRLRSGPDTTNGILATLSKGTQVSVLSASNGWLKVSVDDLTGWVSGEYISLTGDSNVSLGTVKGTSVRFRSGAGTNNSILATMPVNARLCVYGTENDWVKCSYNGKIGYISASYVNLDGSSSLLGSGSTGTTTTEVPTINHNASLGEQIAQYACQFYKYPYVYGEESPSKGFDCSGLVYYVYHSHYGYSMHRTASTQYRYDGVYVNKSELQPGDLVFFNGDGSGVTHVGIFVGSGQYGSSTFIHASGTGVGVIYSDLNSSYYNRVYYGAKRIV